MKVVAFNGSVRKEGNTALLLSTALAEIAAEGIETELYELAGKPIQGCIACYQCFKNKDRRCAVTKDIANECVAKMDEADGILLGSPTYFADVSASMKPLIERCGMVGRANPDLLRRKVGAGVVYRPDGWAAARAPPQDREIVYQYCDTEPQPRDGAPRRAG